MTVEWTAIKEYSEILFERSDAVAKVTMNNPARHNAFTPVMMPQSALLF